jgi:hypothetical protein
MREKQNYKRIYDLESIKKTRDLEHYISEFKDEMTNYEWLLVTKSEAFNLDVAEQHIENINWSYLCTFYKLPIKFMEKHFEYLDLYSVSAFQVLTFKFIEAYKESLSMDKVIKNESVRNMPEYSKVNDMYLKMSKEERYTNLWAQHKEKSMFVAKKTKILTSAASKKEPEKPKYKKKDLENMKKPELQEILDDMKVGYFYKNTVPELIDKILSKQKRVRYNESDLDGIKKSVLHDILEERGVKIYYHDTVDELKQKVLDSNPK